MELSTGCLHCENLIHDDAMANCKCKKNDKLKLKYAGACMVAEFTEKDIIVENCPDFTKKIINKSL